MPTYKLNRIKKFLPYKVKKRIDKTREGRSGNEIYKRRNRRSYRVLMQYYTWNSIVEDPAKEKFLDNLDRDFVANDDLNDNLVTGWSWIWDNDFEIDNFKPTEIQRAINDVCGTNISLEDVENIYDSCKNNEKKGIKDIDSKVKNHKIEINKKAFEYMKEDIEKSLNISINDRKIFSILDELIDMSILNHSPVNTSHALRNQKELSLCILKDYNIFKRDEDGI